MLRETSESKSERESRTLWDSGVLQRLGHRTIMCYHSVTDGYTSTHRHPGREMLFVRSGEGVYLSSDRVIPLQGPSLVWIDSRYPHGPHMRGRYERWNVVALPQSNAQLNAENALFIGPTKIRSALNYLPEGVAVASVPGEYVRRVVELFTSIDDELNTGAPFAAEILSLKLAEVGYLFQRFLSNQLPIPPDQDLEGAQRERSEANGIDAKIADAIAYIESHLDEELTADTLSEVLHYSRAQVYRLIRAGTGDSLGHYVKRRRIAKAQRLLELSDLSVKEIARRVGLPHPPHFCKVFREMTNLTPTEYRERTS